jgi:hypothetical protein
MSKFIDFLSGRLSDGEHGGECGGKLGNTHLHAATVLICLHHAGLQRADPMVVVCG